LTIIYQAGIKDAVSTPIISQLSKNRS